MTKDTMIWQTLSMVVAGFVMNKTLPKTKDLFITKCIESVQSIIICTKEEVKEVMNNYDITEFSRIIADVYKEDK